MRMKVLGRLTQFESRCNTLRAEIQMMIPEQLRCNFVVCVTLLDENNSKRVLHLVLPVPFEISGKRLALVVRGA
jgi:hypothetical protein